MSSSISSISIIGAGKVGSAFGRLFARHALFSIQQILTQSQLSANKAAAFIGAGTPCHEYQHLQRSDMYLLAVPDDQIAVSCARLVALNLIDEHSIVVHCSGAKSSNELLAASHIGAAVASLHPVRSFANPALAVEQFKDTICSIEGDRRALVVLSQAMNAIGAKAVEISADKKLLYHAGSVFANNYLVTLMEVSLRCYQAAGIPAELASAMAHALAQQSVDNVFSVGTQQALTGPIARGDNATVRQQAQVVMQWDQAAGHLYEAFIAPTTALARKDYSEK